MGTGRMSTFTELANNLSAAKAKMDFVLSNWPSEVDGGLDLEHAIQLVGQCEIALDDAGEAS